MTEVRLDDVATIAAEGRGVRRVTLDDLEPPETTWDREPPKWSGNVPSSQPLVDDGPLGTTRDATTWDGVILEGAELAAWDDDLRLQRFVDDFAGDVEPGKALAHRYAARVMGRRPDLRRSEFVQWKRRLLVESGLVAAPPCRLAQLPETASSATRELWPSIEILLHARVLGGACQSDPLPLSRRFLARWAPMDERPVREAMEQLERLGLIARVGEHPMPGGLRPLTLWRIALAEGAP